MPAYEQNLSQPKNDLGKTPHGLNAPHGDPQLSFIDRQLEAQKTANLERLRQVAGTLLGQLSSEEIKAMKEQVLAGLEIPVFDQSTGKRLDYSNLADAQITVAAIKTKLQEQKADAEKIWLKAEDLEHASSILGAMDKAEESGKMVCVSEVLLSPLPPGYIRLYRGVSPKGLAAEFNQPLSESDQDFHDSARTRISERGTSDLSAAEYERLKFIMAKQTNSEKWYSENFQIAAEKARNGAVYVLDLPMASVNKFRDWGNPMDASYVFPVKIARANAKVLAVGPESRGILSQSMYSPNKEMSAEKISAAEKEAKQKLTSALQAREVGYLGYGVSAASFEKIDKLLKAGGSDVVKVTVEGLRRKVAALENSAPLNDAQLRELNESRQTIWASVARELGYLGGEIDARALSTVDSNMFSDGVAVDKLRKALDLPAKEKGWMAKARELLSPPEISTVEELVGKAMDLIKEGKYHQACVLLREKAQGLNLEFKVSTERGWRVYPENVVETSDRAAVVKKINQLSRLDGRMNPAVNPEVYLADISASRLGGPSGKVPDGEYPDGFWQEISLVYLAQWIRALQYKYGNNLSNNASSRDSDVYQFMLKRGVVPTDTFASLYAAQQPSQRLQ